MKSRLFNPLKVYKKNMDIVDFLYKSIDESNDQLVVPYAASCYYTLPLRLKTSVRYNFLKQEYYNLWSLITQSQKKLTEAKKIAFKPPKQYEEIYRDMLEKQYCIASNPLHKSLFLLLISRLNYDSNLFGGPYDLGFAAAFDKDFDSNLSNFQSGNMEVSYDAKLDLNYGFFIQHIPNQNTEAFSETFPNGFPHEQFSKMSNYILICEDNKLRNKIKYNNKIDFPNASLLIKTR